MLSEEKRKEYCIKEAAQAVVHALGGSTVYRLAVAPIGAKTWKIAGRKGGEKKGIFSDCQVSDLMTLNPYIQVDSTGNFITHVDVFKEFVEDVDTKIPGYSRDLAREIRVHLCGELANLMASHIHSGTEPFIDDNDSSITYAQVYAQFLPSEADTEFSHAFNLTKELLQQDEVWSRVSRLAEELEKSGDMDEAHVEGFLPQPLVSWPTGPAA